MNPFRGSCQLVMLALVAFGVGCAQTPANLGQRLGDNPKTEEVEGIIHPDERVYHVPLHSGSQVLLVFEKNTDPLALANHAEATGKHYWGGDLCRIEVRDLSEDERNELRLRGFGHLLGGIRDGALAYWLLTDPDLGTRINNSNKQHQSQKVNKFSGGGEFPDPG